jgi:hypothetical protein
MLFKVINADLQERKLEWECISRTMLQYAKVMQQLLRLDPINIKLYFSVELDRVQLNLLQLNLLISSSIKQRISDLIGSY